VCVLRVLLYDERDKGCVEGDGWVEGGGNYSSVVMWDMFLKLPQIWGYWCL
jgi:hypothetical protein